MKHIQITTIAAVILVGCGEGTSHLNLYEVAEAGDIEAVKQHLADGTDIELKCTGCGSTALGHAAKRGHNEIAELLIDNSADVNVNDGGTTPLDVAIIQNKTETADLLRKHGGKTSEELKAEGK